MTKEHIIQYLNEHHIEELKEMLAYIAKNSLGYECVTWRCEFGSVTMTVGKAKEIIKPSLTSDLDKAAQEYADGELERVDSEIAQSNYSRHIKMGIHIFSGSDLEDAFITGAQWVAEQLNNIINDKRRSNNDTGAVS